MFTEDYEKLTRSERTLFSEALNDLLYQCFIVRKSYDRKSRMFKADPDYLFIERHYSMFEDYLSYMDMDITKSDEDGIIFVTSAAEKNHLRIDTVTTLIVYALRSYYEDAISKAPEETEVLMTYGALNSLLQETGLSNLTKRLSSSTIASSLRTLDSYNVVSRANGTYGDPSYSFFILPTIKFVISAEKMNALYGFLTKPEHEEGILANAFDSSVAPKEEEKEEEEMPRTGVDIPVREDL
ncbi:MAG TPA: DUF4194 domain-containing protein [Candidatus Enterosoma merdigallinarum]|nr:DUF4194 domain-containing protein [Candidatus Enterosoma merdigallinarum]